jgi:hypothetical protein
MLSQWKLSAQGPEKRTVQIFCRSRKAFQAAYVYFQNGNDIRSADIFLREIFLFFVYRFLFRLCIKNLRQAYEAATLNH